MGRMTATPELRKTPSDVSVTTFTVATDGAYNKETKQAQTYWHDCVAWKETADFITNYFTKGQMIAITGELQTRQYTDKSGNNRKAVEVHVRQASFCGSKAETGSGGKSTTGKVQTETVDDEFEEVGSDDDLPF